MITKKYRKVFGENAVIHNATSRVIYLDNAPTIHSEKYLAWVLEGNVAADADIPPTLPPPTAAQLTLGAISALEAKVTPRRIREAVMGVDGGWLADIDAQIANLRKQL